MIYAEDDIKHLEGKLREVPEIYLRLIQRLMLLAERTNAPKAKEYLLHGVGRRLNILRRCVENVYRLFPIRKTDCLEDDARVDVEINLHCFLFNTYGLLDNLAWVIVHHKKILENDEIQNFKRTDVGLFKEKCQLYFDAEFREYLNRGPIKEWHDAYQKQYRDALAHRIPAYIPPFEIDEDDVPEYKRLEQLKWDLMQNMHKDRSAVDSNIDKIDLIEEEQHRLEKPISVFVGSLSEASGKGALHAQLVTDFVTIEEIVTKFLDSFDDAGVRA